VRDGNGGNRAELDLVVHYAVTRVLADSSTLAQAARGILEAICQTLDFDVGQIWAVDHRREVLHLLESWHVPEPGLETFVAETSHRTFAPNEGLPGTVWAAREPTWISDVAENSGFTRRPAARQAGLHAALAFPILQGGKATGVIEFLSAKIRKPEEHLLQLMAVTGAQIGVFMGRKEVEQLVLDSEAEKSAIIGSALDCIITVDHLGRIVEFNPAAETTFGYSRSEAIGAPMVDLIIPPGLRGRHQVGFARYLETGEEHILGRRLEMSAMRADGSEFPVELTVTSIEVPGKPTLFTGFVRDITERRRAEEERMQLASIVESSSEAIISTDLEGHIVTWNGGAHRVFGYTPDEALGRNVSMLVPEDGADEFAGILERLQEGQPIENLETVRVRKNGTRVDMALTISPIRNRAGEIMFVSSIGRDITERRRAEQQIAFMAFHDKLTGLPNRAKFEELMEMALARARRNEMAIAVIHVDVDNFKMVNDSLGHAAGDDVLREIGARLVSLTRETDVVARLGGDEFLLLLSDLLRTPEGQIGTNDAAILAAQSVAVRINDSLKEPFVLSHTEFYVSASVGVSLFPMDAEDGRSLLRNADAAMYQSRKAGPGGYAVFPSTADDPTSALSLATRLRKAVQNEDWVLYYQPIIDLVRGEMIGVEGLLRWRDPHYGIIAPGEFLPLAEEMGLMEQIGDWVMKDLFRQASEWRGQGLQLNVSFNLSPRQLWHPELIENLLARLNGSGVDPGALVIEITESAAMADIDRTQRVLSNLRNGGLRFAIDDFGTGYSSLSRLRDLPVDILKIDRSFVRDVPADQDAVTVVQAIIQLALSLGMAPLAEGIETQEQWQFLVDHGCRLGQGFYFRRPVPADQIPSLYGAAAFQLDSRRAG
jgi:diguanylate cyclase (GGDEF)-like protein/PAS domain S-box-containing protein